MRAMLIASLFAGPAAAMAEEIWQSLTGAEIAAALTDRVIVYRNAVQEFRVSGRTLYDAGQASWGYWAVRGDQYCSMWPPSDLWACYDMARDGDVVRFVGAAGDITEGTLRTEVE
jgi:hypothetical protein